MTIGARPDSGVRAEPMMGTLVHLRVVGHDGSDDERGARDVAIARAFDWFREVEAACSRFDEASELSRLCAQIGTPVPVSPLLYRAVEFALAVADDTDGAFDPTVGDRMQARGFDRHYKTGARGPAPASLDASVTYRDVRLDPDAHTITIARSLTLDLGGVAKGLAIDLAAEALRECRNFAIDAGGDLYLSGHSGSAPSWSVGIRHPRLPDTLIGTVHVSDCAVCTSGDYERPGPAGHHLLDPRTGETAPAIASATVIAPSALVADALATAAFVLGPEDGLALLARHGVEGLLITPTLERHETAGMPW